MQSIFSNALSKAVAKLIGLSATRRETLSWLALLIMQHGTISLWRLRAAFPDIKIAALMGDREFIGDA